MSLRKSAIIPGSVFVLFLALGLLSGGRSTAQSPELSYDVTDSVSLTAIAPKLNAHPNSPIELSANPRYFKYPPNNAVALIGISGDYLPHVPFLQDGQTQADPDGGPSRDNCGYHDLVTAGGVHSSKKKYEKCLEDLLTAGLNKVRIWVGLNHSPGASVPGKPSFPHEQAFKLIEPGTKWDLKGEFDLEYFSRLYEVVKACSDKGIIAEVTLFDPWDGRQETSPWRAAHNNLPSTANQFTNDLFFIAGDKAGTTSNPYKYSFGADEEIDDGSPTSRNSMMRVLQVKLMKQVVDVLNGNFVPTPPHQVSGPLHNFYWELANEPETELPAPDQKVINWHYYMAKKLRDYETTKYHRKHLIAVNYTDQLPIQDAGTNPQVKNYIDIVEAHYVRKLTPLPSPSPTPTPSAVLPAEPYGAIEMIRKFNVTSLPGQPTYQNNKIWGFNENLVTGFESEPSALAVRAEAWEFMFSGGGVYEQLSYKWGNLKPAWNAQVSVDVRDALSTLNNFIWFTNLANMKASKDWLLNPPVYGSVDSNQNLRFWSAMSSVNPAVSTYLYYIHHSKYVQGNDNGRNGGYRPGVVPATGVPYRENNFMVNLGSKGSVKVEWINTATGVPYSSSTSCWEQNSIHTLQSPQYGFDIALRLTKTSTAACPSFQSNVASLDSGSYVTASSAAGASYLAEAVIDGDRSGNNWGFGGGWRDDTDGDYPDWIQVNFANVTQVGQIDIYTLRDDFTDPSDPSWNQTFSLYGITDFQVQYRDLGTCEWITIPDGELTGNDRVWNQFIFAAIKTDAIRVVVNKSLVDKAGAFSRIVEIEAYPESGD